MLTEKQIDNKVAKLIALKLQKKELEKQISDIEDAIKDSMTANVELRTKKFAIKNTLCSRVTLDSEAIKEDYPKIYAQYSRTTEYFRFSYKEV